MNSHFFSVRTFVMLVLVTSLGACATPITSMVDVAEGADPASFKTYAWVTSRPLLTDSADPTGLISPVNERRIRVSIEQELERKGYIKAPKASADIALSFNLGARDRVEVTNNYNSQGYQYYGFRNGFSRHGRRSSRFGFGVGSTPTVRHITEGTLVVDVFDNQQKQAIWHGAATKRLQRGEPGRELVDAAVETLLNQFPDSEVMSSMMQHETNT